MTQAFLWADLDEEVYVTAPPGYDLGRDDHGRPLVFRVLKAIYGLKQSPACWCKLIGRSAAGCSTRATSSQATAGACSTPGAMRRS